MLEIQSLSVSAGSFQLQEVSLEVRAGECHALLGPSGSGKSTLLRAILGVLPPDGGEIRLEGKDIVGLPIEHRGLGYVPQQLGLFPHLTVRGNLEYGARARGVPASTYRPLLDKLVLVAGIEPHLDRLPETLSGGERQRVGLVRALVSQPRVVLLDEPFTALDEVLRRDLWRLMNELQRQWSLTVLLVTHDLDEAFFLADRISVLLSGRPAQQGTKEEVYSRPATAEVARFLGVENLLPGQILKRNESLAVIRVHGFDLEARDVAGLDGDVLVCIRGEDVALENGQCSEAIASAPNRIPARIVSMQPGSFMVSVELDAGFPLSALVPRPRFEELALAEGQEVTAVLLASRVHLVERPN